MSDEDRLIPIDEPYPGDPAPAEPEADDAEPEGAVEIAPGRRMVDVSVVAAERKKARESTETRVRQELAPLQEKANRADALQQALDAAKPYVDLVKQHPHLLQPRPPVPEEDQIPDEQAATYARRYELYQQDGTPDTKRAKAIMADNRKEQREIAQQAAHEAIRPLQAATAEDRSRQNYAAMASLRDADGHPLVDAKLLAEEWVQLDVALTADPKVAEVVLERAIGKTVRKGGRVSAPTRSPIVSEAAGGRGHNTPLLTDRAKKLGLNETNMKEADKNFIPGGMSTIGDWS